MNTEKEWQLKTALQSYSNQIEKQQAEIERLQLELRSIHQDTGAVIAGLQGEIKRLRAALDKAMAGSVAPASQRK